MHMYDANIHPCQRILRFSYLWPRLTFWRTRARLPPSVVVPQPVTVQTVPSSYLMMMVMMTVQKGQTLPFTCYFKTYIRKRLAKDIENQI